MNRTATCMIGLVIICLGCNRNSPPPSPQTAPAAANSTVETDTSAEVTDSTVEPTDSQPEKSPEPAADTEVVKATMKELVAAQQALEADKKFGGKTVELTGLVVEYGTTSGFPERVRAKTIAIAEKYAAVHCVVEGEYPWKDVVPGQTATVRGVWDANSRYTLLENCTIVSVEGPRCYDVTAEELSKELETDLEGLEKKIVEAYEGHCILRGKIANIAFGNGRSDVLELQHSRDGKIRVHLDAIEPQVIEQNKQLKVGDEIITIGRASTYDKTYFNLIGATLLKE